eukprot:1393678-Amorphochlora_amoeboformis.AAC.1
MPSPYPCSMSSPCPRPACVHAQLVSMPTQDTCQALHPDAPAKPTCGHEEGSPGGAQAMDLTSRDGNARVPG